ncbi:DHA2 family efflux MFS transporter permease subunit [Liquorilactobacillus satsumensis]|uniref:DHA2 family efflux MFS transporter permease subunit n=1 Tax=Liquorilactobacillus satsumensis TaxID=259059 RepID=UPI001E455620|nr:DHA2 family efflux MFS transporter permease subunit [Liquorilactobacillus satsumensis]MCC7666063.1 MFS transporter [Liquorilactobacillus satsumensis]MCP9356830.1 DHA2 family efflux MFS transporter permease subunit [Liquorilactobacillus satsumensis]MCP9370770.1 DHA2 family efflux MFS transporter permease subunit [Liquorilactobacillus satsumensis]
MPTPLSSKKRMVVTILLLFSTFISLASQTMMITALTAIEHSLNIPLTSVQWLTTGYILIVGVVMPLSSNLYEKFSNRQVFLSTISLFIIGSLLGAFASSFSILLLARLLQACAGGILMSFQMTAMITIYPPEKRGTVLGMSGLVIAFGPAIGPTISGIILHFFTWQYLFILVLPFMLLILVVSCLTFPNFSQPQKIKIDLLSVFLSLFGSGMALASLTVLQQNILLGIILLLGGLFLLFIFTRRQLHLKKPMLRVQLFKLRSFCLLTLIGMLAFMVLIGTEQLVPIFAENVLGLSSLQSGLILLPGAILNALFAALAGRYYDLHGPKLLLTVGVALMLIATVPFLLMNAHTPVWIITFAYLVRMIGNSLVFSPAMSEAFKDVPPLYVSHASALNNSLRQVAAAVSTTLMIVLADLPRSLVAGSHLAISFTVILLLLTEFLFLRYAASTQK